MDCPTAVPGWNRHQQSPLFTQVWGRCAVVNDNINDHWSPFGTGDLLQRANRAAEKISQVDERALDQCLSLVTGGIQPLSWEGELLWPKLGDLADFLLVPAENRLLMRWQGFHKSALLYSGERSFLKNKN